MMLERPVASPLKLKLTSVPHPAGILPPVNENAKNVPPAAWPNKPLADISPPDPLKTEAPSTSN